MITFTTINFILLILWIYIISSKLQKTKNEIETIRNAYNKFVKRSSEHLRVLKQFAHAEGFEIEEDVVIQNKQGIVSGLIKTDQAIVERKLKFVESEEKKKERHFFEAHLIPQIESIIDKMSPDVPSEKRVADELRKRRKI